MLDSITFYNHFGAGDLHESREFVREIIRTVEAREYFYCHGKHPRTFLDIPELKYGVVTERMDMRSPAAILGNSLLLNTWIGRNPRYILPVIGCVVEKNFEMFNDILPVLGLPKLSGTPLDYLPTIDFSVFDIDNIKKFVADTDGVKKVLICNGGVQSCQAENFSFENPILSIADNHKDTIFLVTQPLSVQRDNIISTSDVIQSIHGFDLNEIAYLARFVSCIIGRKSGPFVFAHTKEIWHDPTKKSLSFTYTKMASHFVLSDSLPLRKFWSPATDEVGVTSKMEDVLSEELL